MIGLQSSHSRMESENKGLEDRCLQERDGTDRLPDVLDGIEQDAIVSLGGFLLHH